VTQGVFPFDLPPPDARVPDGGDPQPPAAGAAPEPPDPLHEAAARLRADLEAALVRELSSTYQDLNHTFFRRKLGGATVELSSATSRLGRWVPEIRTIEIARRLVLEHPWGVVV
jgi:hypothetical protein